MRTLAQVAAALVGVFLIVFLIGHFLAPQHRPISPRSDRADDDRPLEERVGLPYKRIAHVDECKRLVNGYIEWRRTSTSGDWRPLGIDDIEVSSNEGRYSMSGVVHFRLGGSRKRSRFTCEDRDGEPKVTMESGFLRGVEF